MAKQKKKVLPAPELVSEHGRSVPVPGKSSPPGAGTGSGTGAGTGAGTTGTGTGAGAGAGTPPTWGTPGVAAYTPDYNALIAGDSILNQQNANRFAGHIASAAERKANTDRAYAINGEDVNFTDAIRGLGLDPNSPMFKYLMEDIDPATQQAARDMTAAGLSTKAKLDRTHQYAINNYMDQLAARGVVRSGATMSASNAEGQNYLGAQFQSRQDLLAYLAGVQSAFQQSETDRTNQAVADTTAATQRQIAEHPATSAVAPIPGTPGTGSGAYTGAPLDTTGYYNAADYFAANPMAQGTTTAQALAALGEASRQLGTSTYSFGGAPPGSVWPSIGVPASTAAPAAAPHNDVSSLSPAQAAATVATPALAPPSSFSVPTPAAPPAAPTSYSNSVFKRLNLPE